MENVDYRSCFLISTCCGTKSTLLSRKTSTSKFWSERIYSVHSPRIQYICTQIIRMWKATESLVEKIDNESFLHNEVLHLHHGIRNFRNDFLNNYRTYKHKLNGAARVLLFFREVLYIARAIIYFPRQTPVEND